MTDNNHTFLLKCLFVFLVIINSAEQTEFSKYRFPKDFLFGVSTSAYQIEGGHNADGKGENIWDHYTNLYPSKIEDYSNGNISCDSFHKWRDDIKLLTNLGVNFYRFSISWSRILPDGYSNNINMNGLRYYNDLINELLVKGIQPMVTLYHRDLPMRLQELGGWTNPFMAYYFEDYARIVFSYFGDRVKYWITLNAECYGYGDSEQPPYINQSGIADYLCTHVFLLAHAKAYHLYDEEFRALQNGKIGIVVDGNWYAPASSSAKDIEAAERVRKFKSGIFLNPIFSINGSYPYAIRERVDNVSKQEGYLKSRLLAWSDQEIEYILGTYDFLGVNAYTSFLVKNVTDENSTVSSMEKDFGADIYQDNSWPKTVVPYLKVHPEGLRKSLKYIKDKYDDPEIFVTENGYPDDGQINDTKRIEYLQKHLTSLLEAIHEDGVTVKGYAVWSLLDNFEWTSGYSKKFGLYHVDFKDPKRKRTAKKSSDWYKKVISRKRVLTIDEIGKPIGKP